MLINQGARRPHDMSLPLFPTAGGQFGEDTPRVLDMLHQALCLDLIAEDMVGGSGQAYEASLVADSAEEAWGRFRERADLPPERVLS